MAHPLTDEITAEIAHSGYIDDYGHYNYTENDLRAVADWQLEQVIKWLKSQEDYPGTLYYELPTLDCECIECALRHAMRPTIQEDS